MKRTTGIPTLFLALGLVSSPAPAAVSVGMTDTFEDGTTSGWTSGPSNPHPPSNAPSGGPAGSGDRFLLLTSNGVAGTPGGKLVALSGLEWAGDFISAGVTEIRMDVNNLGATDLSLRLYFQGMAGSAFSADAAVVKSGSGWVPIAFSTEPAALTGDGTVALSNVVQWRVLHSVAPAFLPVPPAPPGLLAQDIAAQLGVDNISAVPEPSAWVTMGVGLAILLTARTARGQRLSQRGHAP